MNLLDAVVQNGVWEHQRLVNLARTGCSRGDRFHYGDSTVEVNAVYQPNNNTIYILAGVLLPDFFDEHSYETMLGTLGQTIGHELSHGFETNGVQYNATGESVNILMEEDQVQFGEKVSHLTDLLNRVELADGVNLDASHVLNETYADLLGLRLTLDLAGQAETFDYDLFFRTVAHKFFRRFLTREAALQEYSVNPHPSYTVRVNYVVAQFEEFYQAYPSVREGTPMYVAPEDRELLW